MTVVPSPPAAEETPGPSAIPSVMLYPIFLLSGFAALLYQIVWQRSLFRMLGTSTESVTMVVTAFMLGLGLGSLTGGAVSTRARWPLLVVFGTLELGIGAFGLGSLRLFAWAASVTGSAAGLEIGAVAFLLVFLPTLLMGATLPILVAELVRRSGNVGGSVGRLYFANTLGSALGSVAAGLWILGALGQERAVLVAALTNFAVAGAVLAAQAAFRRRP